MQTTTCLLTFSRIKRSAAATMSECIQPPGSLDCGPDDHLLLAALRVLQSSSYGHVRKLRCEVAASVVTLLGVVPSYFLKQVAQEVVLRLNYVQHVKNLVEVRRADFGPALDPDEEP